MCLVYSLLCQSAGNVLTRTPRAAQMVCSHMASRQIVSHGPLLILDYVTRPRQYEIKIQKRFISAGRINTSNTSKVVSQRCNKQSPILLRRCYEDTHTFTHIHTVAVLPHSVTERRASCSLMRLFRRLSSPWEQEECNTHFQYFSCWTQTVK